MMPRKRSSSVDKEGSPPTPSYTLASTQSGNLANPSLLQPAQSIYPSPGEPSTLFQPTYSQTILQTPTLATDPSTLPPQNLPTADPPSATSRRPSSSSMRNASTTFENVTPGSTPTGRISKAKKGKRVHACEFPGCGKVFTRAEHRRRHELNHNPEASWRCPQPGCNKSFHRIDLLQRHQERHDQEASPSQQHASPRHTASTFASPPSVMPTANITSTASQSDPRTSSGDMSIGSLVHPPPSHYDPGHSSLYFGNSAFVPGFYSSTTDPYPYGSEGSHSPTSDHTGHFHRSSISSPSLAAHYEPLSPTMTSSMPGQWMPATTAAPPIVLPSNVFEEGQAAYMASPTVNSMPVHLRELDGHEFTAIQRELSNVPGLVFDTTRSELSSSIRSYCLDLYWKHFHPSFPIVYKPNFVGNTPPPLLLSAVLAIGSFYDTRPDARLYFLALQEITTKLLRKRDSITSRSRIADLQIVLLLEILSKYCARQSQAHTSSRFQSLFASLHQSKQWLSTSPLAVYKSLGDDKSKDGLERAHKFWLEHEARRRIFHACSVLDAQQVALFDQRPTIVTHNDLPTGVDDLKTSVDLPCEEALWEASPLEEWSTRAAECISEDVNTARRNYQNASVDDYSFFQHQIINANGSPNQRCAEELGSPPSSDHAISGIRFNYHVFQMAKHIPVRSLLIVVGVSWFLGRRVEQESEYTRAKQTIRDWVTAAASNPYLGQVASALYAHWHALKVLRMVAPREGSEHFRSTYMLHEDWSVYLAALVCWVQSYGRGIIMETSATTTVSATPPTPPPSMSRKRKTSEVETPTPPRKRQTTIQVAPSATSFISSSAAHSTQMPHSSSMMAYANTTWPTCHPINYTSTPWTTQPSYDASLLYPTNHDPTATTTATPSATDSSAYASTVLTARTANNTPQSISSFATTIAPTFIPTADAEDSFPPKELAELRQYLNLTNVGSVQDLATLDLRVLGRINGVLDAIRIHKIGAKRVVGGLMNDAERVLVRLAEDRGVELF